MQKKFGTEFAHLQVMENKQSKRQSWLQFPPLLIIGAVIILAPIFYYMTVHSLSRQRDNVERLLVEKGAALIRSFEAGSRTGMMGMGGNNFQIQHLLSETASQPDISYLIVTDSNGVVLAHNDLPKVGSRHGIGLDLPTVAASESIRWQRVTANGENGIFEVYSRFKPIQANIRQQSSHQSMHGKKWPTSFSPNAPEVGISEQIIFVGLNMAPIEEARQEDARHTIVMAVILLLICLAGLFTVFLLQAYRSAHSSLKKVTLFSERLAENMPIGLLALDASGKIAALNKNGEFLLGIKGNEVLGLQTSQCLPVSFVGLTQKLKDHSGVFETELDCILADGLHLPLEVIAAPLSERGDSNSELVILFRDLTEIKELKKEIVRSQRLAAIGRLAAGVAHEIRNPLSSIKGFATYFRERYQDVAEDQKIASIMIQEVERLNRVIGQLLEFARPLEVQKTSVSLKDLFQQSVKMVEEDAHQKGITIKLDVFHDPDQAWIDSDRMKQILLNLYLNSIEAMDSGGNLKISSAVKGNMLEINIQDDGKGIPKGDIGSIFDPYFTTKFTGTGLGLAIVHKIVEALGGQISVQSELELGAVFSLKIPIPEETVQ